jgi:toxin ParE1/3/4
VKRYLLTDEAKEDIADIRKYLKREAGLRVAQSTVKKIRDAIVFLSRTPGAGHLREDLTDEAIKFWPVFSYLIVYNPAARPIEILRIIHGSREVAAILSQDD